MIKISLKGLADFMGSDAAKQRKILREFKYPDTDEAQAKIVYYRDARDRIAGYHRLGHDRAWLIEQADAIDSLAGMSTGMTRTRLRHNARALREYERNFGGRNFEGLSDARYSLVFGDVRVSAVPDLRVRERDAEKIIKLEFSVSTPTPNTIRVISQGLFEASVQAGASYSSSCVLYLDVPRGGTYQGARVNSRTRSNIVAACQNIEAIWPSL
jgi:hypothetical protein